MARLLTREADHLPRLVGRSFGGRRRSRRRRRSRGLTLPRRRGLLRSFVEVGHGFGHLLGFPCQLLKEKTENEIKRKTIAQSKATHIYMFLYIYIKTKNEAINKKT